MQRFRVVYPGISHGSLVFSRYTHEPFMVYYEKAVHNYFIPCHRKYRGQHNATYAQSAADFSLNDFELAFYQSCVQDLDATFIKRIKCIVDFKIKSEGNVCL